jgi:hypothetical protein
MSEVEQIAEPVTGYEIGGDGVYTGRSMTFPPGAGLPTGWTREVPRTDPPDGKVMIWAGGWMIGDPPPPPPGPDMPALRKAAFERAMAVGKRIEQAILGRYTAGEPLTWESQASEARIVVAGGTLAEDAILPTLAADRGVELLVMADLVLAKAAYFKQVVRAGQQLRRAAEGLLSPALDTPASLNAAVEALRVAAAEKAAALGLPLPQ